MLRQLKISRDGKPFANVPIHPSGFIQKPLHLPNEVWSCLCSFAYGQTADQTYSPSWSWQWEEIEDKTKSCLAVQVTYADGKKSLVYAIDGTTNYSEALMQAILRHTVLIGGPITGVEIVL